MSKPLTAQELFALSDLLEADDLLRETGLPLTRDEIFVLLEALWARGVDLRPALDNADAF